MTNPDRPDKLTMDDLERDLPTTAEDVEALRRLRYPRVEDYFAALARLPQPSYEELLRRKGPRGGPFEFRSQEFDAKRS